MSDEAAKETQRTQRTQRIQSTRPRRERKQGCRGRGRGRMQRTRPREDAEDSDSPMAVLYQPTHLLNYNQLTNINEANHPPPKPIKQIN